MKTPISKALKRALSQGIYSQRWRLVGYGGTVAGALRPVQEWADARVELAKKKDAALLRQALEALEHHVEQTRPIHRTSETITALQERLGEKT